MLFPTGGFFNSTTIHGGTPPEVAENFCRFPSFVSTPSEPSDLPLLYHLFTSGNRRPDGEINPSIQRTPNRQPTPTPNRHGLKMTGQTLLKDAKIWMEICPKDHWTLKTGVILRTHTPLHHTGSFTLPLEGPRSLGGYVFWVKIIFSTISWEKDIPSSKLTNFLKKKAHLKYIMFPFAQVGHVIIPWRC